MSLVAFSVASSGGREVYVNPDQVVCLMDSGDNRTQVVTTGLTGESSISLVVSKPIREVALLLNRGGVGGYFSRTPAAAASAPPRLDDAPPSAVVDPC